MTPREANAELLAEIAAPRDRLATSTRQIAEVQEALTLASQREAATSEILGVIASSPTEVQPIFDAIASRVVRLCDGFFSTVWRYDGTLIHHAADNYPTGEMRAILTKGYPAPAQAGTIVGQAISQSRIIHVEDLLHDSAPPASRGVAIALGYRTVLCVPMLREGVSIGAIAVARQEARPFSDPQIKLVRTFADQAVIAIENVRLFNETKEALDQQTATGEVLSVISASPTELQPVLEVVVKSAVRFCGADDAVILRLDGERLWAAAHDGPVPVDFGLSVPCVRGTVGGRSVLERRAVHVADLQAETDEFPEGSAFAKRFGARTTLGVPLLHDGTAVGTTQLRRTDVDPFTDKQIDLLKTFADQVTRRRIVSMLSSGGHPFVLPQSFPWPGTGSGKDRTDGPLVVRSLSTLLRVGTL